MQYRQLNISIPEEVYRKLKAWIPPGKITDFVVEQTELGLHLIRFKKALDDSYGAWSGQEHPELKQGVSTYIRRLRRGRQI